MIAGDPEVLRKAKELDDMARSVTSLEADVLERVLGAFRDEKRPQISDAQKISAMYSKYLEPHEAESGSAISGEDDAEYPVDDEIDL